MAPGANVFHGGKATGDTSEAVQVVQDGATRLQVVRVSGGLENEKEGAWSPGTQTGGLAEEQLGLTQREKNSRRKFCQEFDKNLKILVTEFLSSCL